MYFQNAQSIARAVNWLTREMEKSRPENSPSTSHTEPENQVTEDSLWSSHDQHVRSQVYDEDSAGGTPIELRQYLNRPVLSRETNAFKAWEVMKLEYPNLYLQARRYLPAVSTSVPSERLFSVVKLVRTDIRSRLSSEHSSQLTLLGSLSEVMWDKYSA